MDRLPFLKQVNVINQEAVNTEGEVYTVSKKIQIVQEDDSKFLLMYHHIIGLINGIDSLSDIKVIGWIADHLNYNECTIIINKFIKEKIITETKLAKSTINNSITSLVEKGFLVKDLSSPRSATYHVNPSYLFYGDTATRKGKLKVVLELKQFNDSPDKEREIQLDIKRYEEMYHKGLI